MIVLKYQVCVPVCIEAIMTAGSLIYKYYGYSSKLSSPEFGTAHLWTYCITENLAVDWLANNLYWTDSFWARIEVMDLDTRERAELVRTGSHSIPRAIVVDPMTR